MQALLRSEDFPDALGLFLGLCIVNQTLEFRLVLICDDLDAFRFG